MKKLTYKIEKGIPVVRATRWDPELPEYVTMLKMKIGDSFEFPAKRVKFVHNAKQYLKKNNPDLAFVATTPGIIKSNKLKKGRVWRVLDGPQRAKPVKARKKRLTIEKS